MKQKTGRELVQVRHVREQGYTSFDRPGDVIHTVPEVGTLSPQLLDAYLQIFNLVNPGGLEISKTEKLAMVPSAVQSLATLDLRTLGLLKDLFQQSLSLPGDLDISQPGVIIEVMTHYENALRNVMEDPDIDPDLLDILQFFLFQLNFGDIRSGNFALDRRIGRVDRPILSPNRKIKFTLLPYTHAQKVSSMGGTVQAVIMNPPTRVDHLQQHQPSTDILAELFFQLEEEEAREAAIRLRRSEVGVYRDPLLFIPDIDITGFSQRQKERVATQYRALQQEIHTMVGMFVETLYDFVAPIHLNIRDTAGMLININELLNNIYRFPPNMVFRYDPSARGTLDGQIRNMISNASMGTVMRFYDDSPYGGRNVHPQTPSQLLEAFEVMLRKRFNKNFSELRTQVSKVADKVFQMTIAELSKSRKLTVEEKNKLRFQIHTIYSTWLTMALTQYDKMALIPVTQYREGVAAPVTRRPAQSRQRNTSVAKRR